MTGFQNLSADDVHLILLLLTPQDIATCRAVCKQLLEQVDTSTRIRLMIELYVEGRILSHNESAPAHEILDHLTILRKRIHEPSPKASEELNSLIGSAKIQIWDGVMAYRPVDGNMRSIHFAEIKRSIVTDSRWCHKIDDLGWRFNNFTFDLSLDLLVVSEQIETHIIFLGRLRFLSISLGDLHPLAAKPVFLCEPSHQRMDPPSLWIFGDSVARLSVRSGCLQIYNWKTGQYIMNLNSITALYSLDLHNILVLRRDMSRLYHISLLPEAHIATELMLPFDSRYGLTAKEMYGATDRSSDYPHYLQKQRMDTEKSLGIFFMEGVRRSQALHTYHIVFSKQLILDLLSKLTQGANETQSLKWKDWGPDRTRWISSRFLRHGTFSVSGSQLCCIGNLRPPYDKRIGTEQYLQILDFNPRQVHFGPESYSTDEMDVYTIKESWKHKGIAIKEPVESALPFRAYISRKICEYTEVHLDGDTIIGRCEGKFFVHPPPQD